MLARTGGEIGNPDLPIISSWYILIHPSTSYFLLVVHLNRSSRRSSKSFARSAKSLQSHQRRLRCGATTFAQICLSSSRLRVHAQCAMAPTLRMTKDVALGCTAVRKHVPAGTLQWLLDTLLEPVQPESGPRRFYCSVRGQCHVLKAQKRSRHGFEM